MKILNCLFTFCLCILLPLTTVAGEVHFYHTDNFGTPMVMTDINGNVVWRSDELPFGEEYQTEEIPVKNTRRFLGKELDKETGLICMGQRYLDPRTGRFTQLDPVGLVDPATGKVNQEMLLNPQRLNRYVYALNNPYKYVDPEGDFAIVGAALIGAAIAYFSHPDIANAPRRASSPTYESHGARNIAIGTITGGAAGAGAKWAGGVLAARKIATGNPFNGKTAKQIDRMFRKKGFTKSGPNPSKGTGGYVNPKTGRSYHIDPEEWGNNREPNHVDVNRLRGYKGSLKKKKLPYKRR